MKSRPRGPGSLGSYKCLNERHSQFGHATRFRLSSQTRTNRCPGITANTLTSIYSGEKKLLSILLEWKQPINLQCKVLKYAVFGRPCKVLLHVYSAFLALSWKSLPPMSGFIILVTVRLKLQTYFT